MVMMQIAPSLLPPSKAEEMLRGLDDVTRQRVERLFYRLDDALAFVARVESAEHVDAVLTVAAWQYFEIVKQAGHTLTESGVDLSEWSDLALHVPSVLGELIGSQRDLFGVENTEILLSTIDSLEGFLRWVVESQELVGPERQESDYRAALVFEDFLKATVALYTFAAIANGRVTDWKTEAISPLARAVDMHMERVEDRFLDSIEPVNSQEVRLSANSVLRGLADIGL